MAVGNLDSRDIPIHVEVRSDCTARLGNKCLLSAIGDRN